MYHDDVFFFYLYSVYITTVLVIRHVVNICLFFLIVIINFGFFVYSAISNIDNLMVFLCLD